MIFFHLSHIYFSRTTSRNPYNSTKNFPHIPLRRPSFSLLLCLPSCFRHQQPLQYTICRAICVLLPCFPVFFRALPASLRLSPLTKHAAHGIVFRHNGTAQPRHRSGSGTGEPAGYSGSAAAGTGRGITPIRTTFMNRREGQWKFRLICCPNRKGGTPF